MKKLFALIVALTISGAVLRYVTLNHDGKDHNLTRKETQELLDRSRSPAPKMASACKSDPDGYIYFMIGEEIFRHNQTPPIQVWSISPDPELHTTQKIMDQDTSIPLGCEGNPYTGVVFNYEYQDGDTPVGNIQFSGFGLSSIPPERYRVVSWAEEWKERYFYIFKESKKPCDDLTDELIRCIWPTEHEASRPRSEWTTIYFSDSAGNLTALGNPFILLCQKYSAAEGLRCEASYRLYRSIDITYAFFTARNDYWREENVIELDKHIRRLIENMRIKS